MTSPYFKDIYIKIREQKVEIHAERYILLDYLLLKLVTEPGKESTVLAVHEKCVDVIATLYHESIFQAITIA